MQCIEHNYRQDDWWDKINFAQLERNVRQLQGRIFSASKKGNKRGVKNLMKLLARSWSAKILAIYMITQKNKGRATPGIDGKVYLTSKDRIELSKEKFDYKIYRFQPILRRYIPKTPENWREKIRKGRKQTKRAIEKTKMRPLGLMTIKDRVMTTIISFALTAKWEALLDANVFGFRPGRSTQDAVQRIYYELIKGFRIILDADIQNFFDNIKHTAILSKLTLFYEVIKRCLKAGIVDNGKKQKTFKGIVQGSPISPLLANIALHGLQQALGMDGSVIIYADDFIVIAKSISAMKRAIPKLANFMKEQGLSLKREKTRITTKQQGFNFLGFTIEQPRKKLYVKPQKERVKSFLDYIRLIIWSHKQIEQRKLIALLNPIIRGWAMYYRFSDAWKAFDRADSEIWRLVWRWSERRHKGRKGRRWVFKNYFGNVNGRKWVFRDKKTGYALTKASDTKRLKYVFIVKDKSPFDPAPEVRAYWEKKKRRYADVRYTML